MIQIIADNYEGTKLDPLPISYADEHGARTVVFNIDEFRNEFGDGTFSVRILRPTEKIAYLAEHTWLSSEGFACWDVTEVDTAIEGLGEVQITYYPNETMYDDDRAKTKVWVMRVKHSILNMGELPPEAPSILDHILSSEGKAKSAADSAEMNANLAGQSAEQARQYMEEAKSFTPTGYQDLVVEVGELNEDLTALEIEHKSDVSDIDKALKQIDYRLTNVEYAQDEQLSRAVSETETSYVHELPTDRELLPMGNVAMIGGMTKKAKNVIDLTKVNWLNLNQGQSKSATIETNRAELYPNTTTTFPQCYGDIYLSSIGLSVGDSVVLSALVSHIPEGKKPVIFIELNSESDTVKTIQMYFYEEGRANTAFTIPSGTTKFRLVIRADQQKNFIGTIAFEEIQIEKGTEFTSFEPHYDGLNSGLTEEVFSTTDVHMLTNVQFNWILNNTDTLFDSKTMLAYFATDEMVFAIRPASSGYYQATRCAKDGTITETGTIYADYAKVVYETGVRNGWTVLNSHNGYVTKDFIGGTTKLNEKLLELDGYGLGINDQCFNEVSFVKEKFYGMKHIDLGELDWSYSASTLTFTAPISGVKLPSGNSEIANILCSDYFRMYANKYNDGIDRTISVAVNGGGTVFVRDSRYNSAESFKNAVKGIILYYEATEGGEDVERYLYHKMIAKDDTDLGSYNWMVDGNYTYANTLRKYGSLSQKQNILLSNGATYMPTMTEAQTNNVHYWKNSGSGFLEFRGEPSTIKSLLNGIYVYYELAVEQILDITDLVEKMYIPVEQGGTVTFVNENRIDVPHTLEYAVKL